MLRISSTSALVLVLAACGGSDSTTSDATVPDSSTRGDAAAPADGSVADAGPSDAGPTDGGVSCTPSERLCEDDVARVCVTTGDAWNELACGNGCTAGECEPMSLETGWLVHQFNLINDSITTPASYSFEDGGLVAVQSANPMASVYYNDTLLPEGIEVTGTFSVRTTADDDLIGFVFGWQDPEHFYLLDWKQTVQNDGTCGLAEEGATLKLIDSATALEDCTDLWQSSGTDGVSVLSPASANPNGWDDNVDYELRLRYRPGDILIEIRQDDAVVVSVTSTDSTYRNGKFGFFNYSQQGVRYELFSFSPLD